MPSHHRAHHPLFVGQRGQRGQAILLIALLMVVLLGFIGLAIDGGVLYKTQRDARNAADAAMLAATYRLCTGGDSAAVQAAGLAAAATNDFDNDGVTNTVTVNNPPASGPAAGNPEFVEVVVWADAPTYLIQLVYTGPTEVSARSTARCRPQNAALAGFSFAALAQTGNKAFDFSGNNSVEFCGGGAWSNAGAESSNNSVPTYDPDCPMPSFTSVGDWLKDENMTAAGFSVDEQTQPPMADPLAGLLPPANPGGCAANGKIDKGTYTISGTQCYQQISCKSGDVVTVQGDPNRDDNVLYISGDADIKCRFSSENVMIYTVGPFSMNSQANSSLEPALTGGPWHGLTLWVNGNDMRINGGADSEWVGTMYAPNATVVLNGGSDNIWRCQVIGQTIDFAGGGGNKVIYDSDVFFTMPPSIEIAE